jgi:hypothetical protein
MSNARFLAATATVLLAATATVAYAVPKSFYMHHASAADLAAAQAGRGSLNRAISAVETLTHGRVLEIRPSADGVGRYDAVVSHDGTVDHALVNLTTGQVAVIDQGQQPARSFDFASKNRANIVVTGSKVSLSEAVADAEQTSRGVAVSATTTPSADGYIVAHDIQTVKADMVIPVLVDAKTGLVIADPQAFASQP